MTSIIAQRFKLVFFVPTKPTSALQDCKQAIFATGAGRFPNYSECCWSSIGIGQFRPIDTANPTIGKVGLLEEVEEARVEILCFGEDVMKNAVKALKKAHPYEEPAYEVYKLEDVVVDLDEV